MRNLFWQYRRQQKHPRVARGEMTEIVRRGRSAVGMRFGWLGQRLGVQRESAGNRRHRHQSYRRRRVCGCRLQTRMGCPRPGGLLLPRKHCRRILGQPTRTKS